MLSDNPAAATVSPVRVVIFDLGNVLIKWDPRRLFRTIFTTEAEVDYFLTHVCHQQWNECQDAGRTWDDAVRETSALFPQYAEAIAAYRDRWPETIGGAITGTVQILDTLRQHGIRVYALTNWSQETFPYALANFDFLQWFDGILVSGEEKLIKPDPAIFELLLSRYAIDRTEAVFIDDGIRNVNAANALGLHALLFSNPDTLRQDLIALGLPLQHT